jgi:hypothetical protein
MEIVAHGLWAGAAAICARRRVAKLSLPWTVFWTAFPDVVAFAPPFVAGLCLRLAGRPTASEAAHATHLHLGLPLYPLGHSLVVFLAIFIFAGLFLRRPVWALSGWALHILIDIPTHSFSYYATQFLWPISDYRLDGVPMVDTLGLGPNLCGPPGRISGHLAARTAPQYQFPESCGEDPTHSNRPR